MCPPSINIKEYLGKYARDYGFTNVEEIERKSRNGVPKSHAEYRYEVAYPSGYPTGKILLDVLYEEIHYDKIVNLPIESPLLLQTGTNEVKHYSHDMDEQLIDTMIGDPKLNKLNRIKKISLEAFYYCQQIELLAK